MIVGILPSVNSINLNRDANLVISARVHGQVEGQPRQKPKKDCDKSERGTTVRCVFQDTEPPESLSILRKSTIVLGAIQRVRFTKVTRRHANIRENKGPSLGKIRVKVLHQRRPDAVKFEDRSQEEIERQG